MMALRYAVIFSEFYVILIYLLDLKQQRKIWFLNVVILIVFGISDLVLYFQGYSLNWAVRTIIAIFSAILLFVYSLRDVKKMPLMIFCYFFASLITGIVGGMVLIAISVDPSMLISNTLYAPLAEISSLQLLVFLCFVTKKMKLKINTDSLGWKEKIAILFLTAIFGFIFVTFQQMEYTGWNEMITALVMLAGMVALYGIVIYIAKGDRINISESKNRMYEESLRQQKVHYDILRQKEKQTSNFIHDADKLLLPLIGMVEKKELGGDLAQLVENLKNTTAEIKSAVKFKTGSDVIDGQLQFLNHKYRHDQVKFELDGAFPENHRIDVLDMISLFSNLLENAFEAVVKTSENRQVRMRIRPEITSLYVSIENGYQGKLKSRAIGFETTKSDKLNHGIGTRIIDDIVKKYNGNLKTDTKNGKFIAEITFPRTIFK